MTVLCTHILYIHISVQLENSYFVSDINAISADVTKADFYKNYMTGLVSGKYFWGTVKVRNKNFICYENHLFMRIKYSLTMK